MPADRSRRRVVADQQDAGRGPDNRVDSYEAQRLHIQSQVNKYFRGRISIGPRALAALQGAFIADDKSGPCIVAEAVFEGLLEASPACLAALFRAGVPVEKLFTANRKTGPAPLREDTLEWIFSGGTEIDPRWVSLPRARARRCAAAKRVWQEHMLTETDLFEAFFQTAYVGPERFGERVDAELIDFYSSGVGRKLLNAGFVDPEAVEEQWDGEPGSYRAESMAARTFRTLAERIQLIGPIDASHDLFQFALWQDSRGRIRVRPFGVGSLGRSSPEFIENGQTLIFRDGLFQPVTSLSSGLTEDHFVQLEDMINSASCSELEFQRFFGEHPELLAGIDYRQIHPQLVLVGEEGPSLIPDFILEPIDSTFCDLLELKLPYESLVVRLQNGSRTRFRSTVNEAVSQMNEYRRYFESSRNRECFHSRYGLKAYNPKMILVIGRRHHFKSDIQRRELCALLPRDFDLWTYDDVLARAQRYRALLTNPRKP